MYQINSCHRFPIVPVYQVQGLFYKGYDKCGFHVDYAIIVLVKYVSFLYLVYPIYVRFGIYVIRKQMYDFIAEYLFLLIGIQNLHFFTVKVLLVTKGYIVQSEQLQFM
jgi:hypothetical protein